MFFRSFFFYQSFLYEWCLCDLVVMCFFVTNQIFIYIYNYDAWDSAEMPVWGQKEWDRKSGPNDYLIENKSNVGGCSENTQIETFRFCRCVLPFCLSFCVPAMIFLSHDKGVKKTSFLCLGVVGFYKNKYYLITTKETGDKYPFVESMFVDELLGG